MKKGLSSIEIKYIIEELKPFLGAKVNRIFQPEKNKLAIELYHPKFKYVILNILLPGFIYYLSEKEKAPEKPSDFAMKLRKHLSNSIIVSISQLGIERIIKICFEKGQRFSLILELFSKGNIILCDENDIIIAVNERQEWKDRKIGVKQKYEMPKNILNILDEKSVLLALKSSEKDIVRTLATNLNLGGIYAEELCVIAKVNKNKLCKDLSEDEIKRVISSIKGIFEMKREPNAVFDGETLLDIVPFKLNYYNGKKIVVYESFSEAIADNIKNIIQKKEEKKDKDKILEIIEAQELHIRKMLAEEENFRMAGNKIYENYAVIREIIDKINELRKKHSWSAVKQFFKDHKIVKNIDENSAIIELEL